MKQHKFEKLVKGVISEGFDMYWVSEYGRLPKTKEELVLKKIYVDEEMWKRFDE